MEQAGTKPAFQRAIPHGTVIIDSLTQVVFFGVSPGCLRALPLGGFQSLPECIPGAPGGILGALFQVSNSSPNGAEAETKRKTRIQA